MDLFQTLAADATKTWTVGDLTTKTDADPVLLRRCSHTTMPIPVTANDWPSRSTSRMPRCVRDGQAEQGRQLQLLEHLPEPCHAECPRGYQTLVSFLRVNLFTLSRN